MGNPIATSDITCGPVICVHMNYSRVLLNLLANKHRARARQGLVRYGFDSSGLMGQKGVCVGNKTLASKERDCPHNHLKCGVPALALSASGIMQAEEVGTVWLSPRDHVTTLGQQQQPRRSLHVNAHMPTTERIRNAFGLCKLYLPNSAQV